MVQIRPLSEYWIAIGSICRDGWTDEWMDGQTYRQPPLKTILVVSRPLGKRHKKGILSGHYKIQFWFEQPPHRSHWGGVKSWPNCLDWSSFRCYRGYSKWLFGQGLMFHMDPHMQDTSVTTQCLGSMEPYCDITDSWNMCSTFFMTGANSIIPWAMFKS